MSIEEGTAMDNITTSTPETQCETVDFEKNCASVLKIVSSLHARNIIAPSSIGGLLRDEYAIPNVKAFTGKKLSAFVKVSEREYQIQRLKSKLNKIKIHLEKNKKDKPTAKRIHSLTAKLANT